MKLRRARIKNFRLLKDLELDFSVDSEKPLTVIRAANETGKTTAETALIWGLYGEDALPGRKGREYPLYPLDSLSKGFDKVEISVEIEFENTEVINAGKSTQTEEKKRYRLTRTCTEYPSQDTVKVHRENEQEHLFEVTVHGFEPVDKFRIKSVIENSIPKSLKDIYFTDGDSAMSFIEAAATTGVKRQRVKDAVEALLGLETLETVIKHLELVARKFSDEIDETDYSKKLERLNDIIGGQDEDIEEWAEKKKEKEEEVRNGKKNKAKLEGRIEEILKQGDKEKLVKQKKENKIGISRNESAVERALKNLSDLLKTREMSASMIGDVAAKGLAILNAGYKKKQIPKVNIPILEELLDRKDCFCGAELDSSTNEGVERRNHIREAIENSREADKLSGVASELFFSVRSEVFGSDPAVKWVEKYNRYYREYADRNSDVKKYTDKLRSVEEEIDSIKDENLDLLKRGRDTLEAKLNNAIMKIATLSTNIEETENKRSDNILDRNKVEKRAKKDGVSTAKIDAARDCIGVFEAIFARMRGYEIGEVSKEMNRIFLEMIGAHPEENDLTLVTRAELTNKFDIKVYGAHGHRLNPDTDLNGASRRAITLAFILALTKVSKVEAPNVIDTPLGMMSGFVKQSVLLRMLQEGSQTILFLTHDEIKGVEGILDKNAGVVYTLTNPAHYPKMLVNQSSVSDQRILRCECNHRESCEICDRKDSAIN